MVTPGHTGRSHAANTAKTTTFTVRGWWPSDSLRPPQASVNRGPFSRHQHFTTPQGPRSAAWFRGQQCQDTPPGEDKASATVPDAPLKTAGDRWGGGGEFRVAQSQRAQPGRALGQTVTEPPCLGLQPPPRHGASRGLCRDSECMAQGAGDGRRGV